jgi:diguanylate cyclase (GGDEF)-like protein
VNDTWGHPVGDRVLREVAQVLPGLARVSDTPARFGGEEFVLLAPETSAAQAEVLAERIKAAIGSLRVEEGGARIRVTVSIGVGMLDPANMDQSLELIASADRAMYRAKALGGNCVCLASGGRGRDPEARLRAWPSWSP